MDKFDLDRAHSQTEDRIERLEAEIERLRVALKTAENDAYERAIEVIEKEPMPIGYEVHGPSFEVFREAIRRLKRVC